MDDSFDPYHRWLGIPPESQPADHYQLLGIGQFEDDPDVIANAADRQMAHIRTFQSGRRGPLSQQILNELSTANICLLNDERRAEYNEKLRAEQQTEPVKTAVAAPPAPRPSPAPAKKTSARAAAVLPAVSTSARHRGGSHQSIRRSARKKSSAGLVALIGGGLVGVAVLLIALLIFKGDGAPEVARSESDSPDAKKSNPIEAESTQPKVPSGSPSRKSPNLPVAEKKKRPEDDGQDRKRTDKPDSPKPEPPTAKPDNDPSAKNPPDVKKPDVKKPEAKNPDVKKEEVKQPDPVKDGPDKAPPVVTKIDWKTFSLVEQPPNGEAAKAAPLPAAKVLKAQRARVLRIFEPEIRAARSDPDARKNFAKRLISLAEKSEDEAPLLYALLEQARDVTVEMTKPAVFLPIIDWMADVYQTDVFEEKLKAITRAISNTTDRESLGSLADAAVEVHRQADERQLYDMALRLAKSARVAARKAKDVKRARALEATIGQAEGKQREYRKAQRALTVLIDSPDDPAASGAMGRFLAFTRDDWTRGLPLLAKSPDAALAELAKRDLTIGDVAKQETSALATLADAWLARAKKEGKAGRMHAPTARRARHWYQRALPDQKGIERIKTRRNIEAIDEATSDSAASP